MQRIVIGKNQAGQRLDKFLHKYLPQAGNAFLYKMLRKKNITLNGRKAEGREILAEGDEVDTFFSEETFAKFAGQEGASGSQPLPEYAAAYQKLIGIGILYEDEHIAIVNKPAGILSQKAELSDLSLNEWLTGYLLANGSISEDELRTFHPSVCNRLDRNTSGIVLCGKSLAGLRELGGLLKESGMPQERSMPEKRGIRKFYRAICAGEIRQDMVLEGMLKKDSKTNKVTVECISGGRIPGDGLSVRPADGKDAPEPADCQKDGAYVRTAFRSIACGGGYTYLEAELFTGKSHQIRAQLAAIGHPVIGDRKYGDAEKNQYFLRKHGLKTHLLHAYCIQFPPEVCGEAAADAPKSGRAAALNHCGEAAKSGCAPALQGVRGRKFSAPCPKHFERIAEELFPGSRC